MDRYGRSWYDGVCIGRTLGDPRMSAPHGGHGLIGIRGPVSAAAVSVTLSWDRGYDAGYEAGFAASRCVYFATERGIGEPDSFVVGFETGFDAGWIEANETAREQRAWVVSGFPAIGKTTLCGNPGQLNILDSDSTDFSWSDSGKTVRHPEWPRNYIEHIRANQASVDLILVSTHATVTDALVAARIPFTLIYPALEMQDEYIARYVSRGSSPKFVELLRRNYAGWITEHMGQRGCEHVVLQPGQYLSDVVDRGLDMSAGDLNETENDR